MPNKPAEDFENEPLTSPDPISENLAKLRELYPSAFNEDGVDPEALLLLIGEEEAIANGEENFRFSWRGKRQAIKGALAPSTGTLLPARDESSDWDETKNVFIEGDNLEALKLLKSSYSGKVNLIYIDPPYNTGSDFVYQDDFTDSIANYKRQSGQVDDEGNPLTSSSETSGRFHTDWLNMIYPRLLLAQSLLAKDGVILCSIDYHESYHLRKVMNEIFGEANFIGEIYWESKTKSQNTKSSFNKLQPKAEMILAFTRGDKRRFNVVSTGEKEYPETDERGPFRFAPVEEMKREGKRGRESMVFPILGIEPRAGKQWQVGSELIAEYLDRGDLVESDGRPIMKIRPDDERTETTEPFWGFFSKEIGTAESAKKDLGKLMGEHGFDTVKPLELLKRLVFHTTSDDDLVLDFFAGSGTTGHAVMAQNSEDGGSRRYILVQLPEALDPEDKDQKVAAKYCDELGKDRTIAEVTKERLRRASQEISEAGSPDIDTGFRVFKLETTNIRAWDPDLDDLQGTIEGAVETLKGGRSNEDILYELLLKQGVDLCAPFDSRRVGGDEIEILSIDGGAIFACLADGLGKDAVEEVGQCICDWREELQVDEVACIFKDSAFAGSNQAKANLLEILAQRNIKNVRCV